jgi:hypothetical protein
LETFDASCRFSIRLAGLRDDVRGACPGGAARPRSGPRPSDPSLEPSKFPDGGDHRKPDGIVERKQALRYKEKQKHPTAQKPTVTVRVLDHVSASRPVLCATC